VSAGVIVVVVFFPHNSFNIQAALPFKEIAQQVYVADCSFLVTEEELESRCISYKTR
jgi:hypothetical protein